VPHEFAGLRLQTELELVRSLEECPTITDDGGLPLLLDYVREGVDELLRPRHHALPALNLRELVHTCVRRPNGLTALVTAVELVAGGPTARAAALAAAELEALSALDGELTAGDWHLLRDWLDGQALPDAAEITYSITGDRLPRSPARTETMWQLFVHLAPYNAAPPQPPPWLAFLELAANRLGEPTRAHLLSFTRSTRRRWGMPVAEPATPPAPGTGWVPVTAGVGSPGATRPPAESTAYLMIQIEPLAAQPELLIISSWRQWELGPWRPQRGEDETVAASKVEASVERLVLGMEEAWAAGPSAGTGTRANALTVEFILPDDLFGLPLERVPLESGSVQPTPLGVQYPVAIRSLSRLRSRRWERRWDSRWRLVDATSPHGVGARAHRSVWSAGTHLRALNADLSVDDVVCLVLSAPAAGPHTRGGQEAELALRAGCPILLWHRSDCSSEPFRREVQRLLADGDFRSLPRRVHQIRVNAEARIQAGRPYPPSPKPAAVDEAMGTPPEPPRNWDDEGAGFELALLWDDPRRRPDTPAG